MVKSKWRRVLDLPYDLTPALSLESALVHVKDSSIWSLHIGRPIRQMEKSVTGANRLCQMVGHVICNFSCLGRWPDLIVGRVSMDQITIRLPKDLHPLGTKVT